jgi:hypothetical protein
MVGVNHDARHPAEPAVEPEQTPQRLEHQPYAFGLDHREHVYSSLK